MTEMHAREAHPHQRGFTARVDDADPATTDTRVLFANIPRTHREAEEQLKEPTPFIPKDHLEQLRDVLQAIEARVAKPLAATTNRTECEQCWVRVRSLARANAAAISVQITDLAVENKTLHRMLLQGPEMLQARWLNEGSDVPDIYVAVLEEVVAIGKRARADLLSSGPTMAEHHIGYPDLGPFLESVFDADALLIAMLSLLEARETVDAPGLEHVATLCRDAWRHREGALQVVLRRWEDILDAEKDPPYADVPVLLMRLNGLQSHGEIDRALAVVFEWLDAWMRAGRLRAIDRVLANLAFSEHLDPAIALAALTATLKQRDVLEERAVLYRAVHARLRTTMSEAEADANLQGLG